jgi:predicted nucleic acid-binding protein
MHKTIISDTSCLIVLSNIGELELLHKTYNQITTTPEVVEEYEEELPDWVEIVPAKDKNRQHQLEAQLGKGEASAITLALEIKDSTIILDDAKARQIAEKLGLDITGTLGIIVKAKLQGTIKSIHPYLIKLKQTNFRMTEQLEKRALEDAGE